ncbi:MAG: S-methyl-5'-thioinosine phosphorylase [Alphaproteobacteria bacterium]|nr:S-methyl-5'-thioinosine phosphorylase [Alphaproteobacteria bacterium]
MLAIVGGSGFSRLANLKGVRTEAVSTPYGEPSGPMTFGTVNGRPMAFLARHGYEHTIAPHEINYCANMWVLKEKGVDSVISIAAVGGIRKEFGPGVLVVPHQIIDYTWGRRATFFEGRGKPVTHIDFTEPYTGELRERILAAAAACSQPIAERGVYAATQGPRLETAAEIDRLERDGADLVGMTGMPEAALARELGLKYAAIAVVANHAAGRGDSEHQVSMEAIMATLEVTMGKVCGIIERLMAQ